MYNRSHSVTAPRLSKRPKYGKAIQNMDVPVRFFGAVISSALLVDII
jgi:hypothetical protein